MAPPDRRSLGEGGPSWLAPVARFARSPLRKHDGLRRAASNSCRAIRPTVRPAPASRVHVLALPDGSSSGSSATLSRTRLPWRYLPTRPSRSAARIYWFRCGVAGRPTTDRPQSRRRGFSRRLARLVCGPESVRRRNRSPSIPSPPRAGSAVRGGYGSTHGSTFSWRGNGIETGAGTSSSAIPSGRPV